MTGKADRTRRGIAERLRGGTLAHALLLPGPRGAGMEETALWIAKAAVCESSGDGACGRCEACRSFEAGADLDLAILRPADRTLWRDRDDLDRRFPDGIGTALDHLNKAKFITDPLPESAGRRLVPLRLHAEGVFRIGKGPPRFDRNLLVKRIANSGLGEAEKAFLHETLVAPHSIELYFSTIGIAMLNGSEDSVSAAGRSALIPFLSKRPAARRRKVVIVEEAERMTEEAQNALLKTLEEPPPDSLLLLTTSRQGGLLDTIRSRCEVVRAAPAEEAAREETAARYFHDIDPEEWDELLLLGEGVPAQAAEHDLEHVRDERRSVDALLRAAETGPLHAYFPRLESWVDEVEEGGENDLQKAGRCLSLVLIVARERALAASSGDDGAAFERARRVFGIAHGALVAIRPGANLRLLLEEFGMDLWRASSSAAGASA